MKLSNFFGFATLIIISLFIFACNSGGDSSSSGGDSSGDGDKTGDNDKISAPGSIEILTNNADSIDLNWDAVTGATSYKLHQANLPFDGIAKDNYSNLLGYISYDTSNTSKKITTLIAGTRYYFVVTALKGDRQSEASLQAHGTTFGTPPGKGLIKTKCVACHEDVRDASGYNLARWQKDGLLETMLTNAVEKGATAIERQLLKIYIMQNASDGVLASDD